MVTSPWLRTPLHTGPKSGKTRNPTRSRLQLAGHRPVTLLATWVRAWNEELFSMFFFPWPYQPYQCYCENKQRVALQRRLPEDDQFVVPHNLYLTMFSPASVNVMPFDPTRGADHARAYATKYCSKRFFLSTSFDRSALVFSFLHASLGSQNTETNAIQGTCRNSQRIQIRSIT